VRERHGIPRGRFCGRIRAGKPRRRWSVEAELVALDVLEHEALLVVVIGGQQSHACRAERDQPGAFGLKGGGATYPSTSHQKRATRSGSAQSKVTWNCLTDAIGTP
jgi:hypothetical protein